MTVDTQKINHHSIISFDLNKTNSTNPNQDSILSYSSPPPSYEQAISINNTAKFKDLQSRAIQIIIDKKPIEQIAYKDGLASFSFIASMPNNKASFSINLLFQDMFIMDLSRYCISDLSHDKIKIFNKRWKNNLLTKILNNSALRKNIFKLNANKFHPNDTETVGTNTKQQIAIMLLDEYNSGDETGLMSAIQYLLMVRRLHQTSLIPSNQLTIFKKFKAQYCQISRNNEGNDSLIDSFNIAVGALDNDLKKYIQQQKTIELDNEFYMSFFNNYFVKIEKEFLQN